MNKRICLKQVFSHLSAGKDDEAGEDDRAKCQLNRKKVKQSRIPRSEAGHQTCQNGQSQKDSWSESEWMFFIWIRFLKSRISSGSRIVSRPWIILRSWIVDDVDCCWVLLSSVQIFGISFDGNVYDDGDQDEEPVDDFADDVDDVLK